MRISDWSSDVCSSDLPAHQLDVLRRVPCPANARGDHGMIPSNDNNGGEERRTLWIVLLLNAAIAAGFFVSGFFADSSALIANGVDNLSDTAVYALSLVALTRGQTWKTRAAVASGVMLQIGPAHVCTTHTNSQA